MKLYVVRHGESVLNRNKCFGGWADTPLTDKGIEDARKAKRELDALHFDRVYCSDLLRAVQTAQVVLPDRQMEMRPSLRELSVGEFQARPVAECTRLYGDICVQARKLRDYTAVGGESHRMQYERTAVFMQEMEQLQDCENAAVFCHEGTIKCMLSYVLGMMVGPNAIIHDNGAFSIFRFSDRWQLDAWNMHRLTEEPAHVCIE